MRMGTAASPSTCGGDDCDDGNANRYPGNVEVCDAEGVDEDCDPSTLGGDLDGDGRARGALLQPSSADGFLCGSDCDDTSPDIRPTAPESCNFVDDDCDGTRRRGGGRHLLPGLRR